MKLNSFIIIIYLYSNYVSHRLFLRRDNGGHLRRIQTVASDKPCMRDMLIARPLHAFVVPPCVARRQSAKLKIRSEITRREHYNVR